VARRERTLAVKVLPPRSDSAERKHAWPPQKNATDGKAGCGRNSGASDDDTNTPCPYERTEGAGEPDWLLHVDPNERKEPRPRGV